MGVFLPSKVKMFLKMNPNQIQECSPFLLIQSKLRKIQREALQTKKRGNFGRGANRVVEVGGSSKNPKYQKFQLGKVQN